MKVSLLVIKGYLRKVLCIGIDCYQFLAKVSISGVDLLINCTAKCANPNKTNFWPFSPCSVPVAVGFEPGNLGLLVIPLTEL
jgi:hypothetical protein